MPKGQNRRGPHPSTQKSYAQRYGITRDQAGKLIRDGVDPEDEPAVQTWIRLHVRTRRSVIDTRAEAQPPFLPSSNGDRALGTLEGLKAFREHEAKLRTRVRHAEQSAKVSDVRAWQEQWVSAYEQMHKAEKALIDVQQKQFELDLKKGGMMRRDVFQQAIWEVANGFRQLLDNAPERVAAKVIGLSSYAEAIEILGRERDLFIRFIRMHLGKTYP